MKCDECLQRIEEYFDGELDAPTASRFSAHLAGCAACAEVAEELRCEAEAYLSYDRPVEVTSALWVSVKARIKNEKPSHTPRFGVNPFGWLAGAFNFPPLAPALAALILVALGIGSGVMLFKKSHEFESMREVVIDSANDIRADGDGASKVTATKETLNETSANVGAVASPEDNLAGASEKVLSSQRMNARNRENIIGNRFHAKAYGGRTRHANVTGRNNQPDDLTAKSERGLERPRNQSPLIETTLPDTLTAASNMRASANTNRDLGDPDREWRTHAERAQMLLRSFRNAPFAGGGAHGAQTIDVAYERRQSKKLLYDNIILRRDAAARGDRSAERLLGSLEPILLDIANLPERPLSGEVRSIEQQMRKKEIVAQLQAQSINAQNIFD
ncbi:MAG: zf-HC2 domain-containing protein [Pyrinomonadaceae bacterium MAG19_C2-C3]|nr:zf-HC2 domain-containing protein [Pyrinomonadaceae bacterium MAG19_C2-C3]